MPVVKKLVKCGNSQAAVLDRNLMRLAGIRPDSWVAITVDGKKLVLEPATDEEIAEREAEHRSRVMAALEETHEEFDDVMRKLAE
jgi:antitoxin component of MazEF toxin-antitoxin module